MTTTRETVTIDTDKGRILGRWICEACGRVEVVRLLSRVIRPPKDPAERCSCSGCCFGPGDRAGTVRWVAAPSLTVVR